MLPLILNLLMLPVNYFNERQSFQFDQLVIKISSTVCSNCVIFF